MARNTYRYVACILAKKKRKEKKTFSCRPLTHRIVASDSHFLRVLVNMSYSAKSRPGKETDLIAPPIRKPYLK